jgi:hypothetical protein
MSMVFVELRLIFAFFDRGDVGLFQTILSQGLTRGSLFHLSVHDVIADYHTHVITKTPI